MKLPPDDAALTRRVMPATNDGGMAEKKGRKVFSRASAATVERIRAELEAKRSTENFAKKTKADARHRDMAQADITPEGHLLGRCKDEPSFKAFLGAPEDLLRNIHGVAPVAELDGDEIGFLLANVAKIKRQK